MNMILDLLKDAFELAQALLVTLTQTLVGYIGGNFALWDTVAFYIRSTNLDRIEIFSMEEMN